MNLDQFQREVSDLTRGLEHPRVGAALAFCGPACELPPAMARFPIWMTPVFGFVSSGVTFVTSFTSEARRLIRVPFG